MNKGSVLAAVVLLAVALGCAGVAVVQAIRGVWSMASLAFWVLVAGHAVTAILGGMLLSGARPAGEQGGGEVQS